MKKNLFLVSASFCSILASGAFACAGDETGLERDPAPIAAAAQQNEGPTVTMLRGPSATYELWEEFFQKGNASAGMSQEDLINGLKLYWQANKVKQWIDRVRTSGLNSFAQAPDVSFVYWHHLLNKNNVFLGSAPHVDNIKAARILFPGEYLDAFRSVTKLVLFNALTTENAFFRSPQVPLMTLSAPEAIYSILCQAGAENLIHDKGKSLAFAKELLEYRQFFDRSLSSGTAWELAILAQIRDQTPGLAARDKAYLDFQVRIGTMKELTRSDHYTKHSCNRMIQEITHFLNSGQEDDSHFQTHEFYPLLAQCEAYLGDHRQALRAWRAYERQKQGPWGQSDLYCAMDDLFWIKNKQSTFMKWWNIYRGETNIDLETFHVKSFEIQLLDSLVVALAEVHLDMEALELGERYLHFLQNEGRRLQMGYSQKRYASAYIKLEANLACLYTSAGRYKEAAAIFRQYFDLKGKTIVLKEEARNRFESVDMSQDSLAMCKRASAVAFVQTGRIKDDSAKKPGKVQAHGTRGARAGGRAVTRLELVQQHLIDHYKERLKSLTKRLQEMTAVAHRISVSEAFLGEISQRQVDLTQLEHDFTKASSGVSTSSKGATPNLGTLGRRIDTLSVSLAELNKQLIRSYVTHKADKKKALEYYLARVIQEEREEALPFVMAPDSPPQPQASSAKQKKRGAASSAHTTSLSATAASKSGPLSAQTVFFQKKQAQMDYEGLDKRARAKANELISEIVLNPYSLVGQGRPERLQTSVGIYFSRRLSDGHRMVYEVVKKPGTPTRVVLISFLSHYKNLVRHQQSEYMTLFAWDGAASSSSSSSAAPS
ncbi:MAG: type II toxin-antitoxin system YoeB family toxin [Proteobacteria bacterium]|nr:type II toxin-antitoxin system YoeB family toxin [Pseudomonadota bacterium]